MGLLCNSISTILSRLVTWQIQPCFELVSRIWSSYFSYGQIIDYVQWYPHYNRLMVTSSKRRVHIHEICCTPLNIINNCLILPGPQKKNIAFVFHVFTINLNTCSTFPQEIHDLPAIILTPVNCNKPNEIYQYIKLGFYFAIENSIPIQRYFTC